MTNTDILSQIKLEPLTEEKYIIWLTQEAADQGYEYCRSIHYALQSKFPNTKFLSIIKPEVMLQKFTIDQIENTITQLQEYLSEVKTDERSGEADTTDTEEGTPKI